MQYDNLNNLIRIMKLTGGKYIFVEDGVPKAVLMDYKDFENLMIEKVAGDLTVELAKIEEVNDQIKKAQLTDLREEIIAVDYGEDSPASEIRVEPITDFDAE